MVEALMAVVVIEDPMSVEYVIAPALTVLHAMVDPVMVHALVRNRL